jgi:hypothetical protein
MLFEYLLVDASLDDRKPSDLKRELNALGAEGWELATAFGLHNQSFVFMRGLPEVAQRKAKGSK